jgi:hypothetical protein
MEWVVNATPRPLYPWKETRHQLYRGWVGMDTVWTSAGNLATPAFGPRTVQPVASCYTD